MRTNIFLILFTLLLLQSRSQSVGIGTGTPNPSAQLEISSTNRGVLISHMTTAQRKAIVNPAVGLLVYDLDKKTIYMYDNNKWQPLMFSTGDNKLPPVSLVADNVMDGDGFGGSVSISGDYAIVGVPLGDQMAGDEKGCAYIFFKSGGICTQQAKIFGSDAAPFEGFGWSVDISGNFAIVGVPFNTAPSNVQTIREYFCSKGEPTFLNMTVRFSLSSEK